MSKLFTALSAASIIVVAAVAQTAAAQERAGGNNPPAAGSTLLFPATAGIAPRSEDLARARAATPAVAPLPETHIVDYSLVFPEEADKQAVTSGDPPSNER